MHKPSEQQTSAHQHIRAAAEALAAYAAEIERNSVRSRFQFSSPTCQRTEALSNLQEAQAHCAPWAAKALRAQGAALPDEPTTEAGQCFRRVSAILSRRTAP